VQDEEREFIAELLADLLVVTIESNHSPAPAHDDSPSC
jgi:hypothetical protein